MPATSPEGRLDRGAETNIGEATVRYGPHHLLSLPSEVLQIIWRKIQEADDREIKPRWFARPQDQFANVLLTSRCLYHSIRASWPHHNTTYNRFPHLMDKHTVAEMQNHSHNVKKYRSVSIELDLRAASVCYRQLARFLHEAEFLEELRLYFFGKDAYGTRVFVHGCGKGSLLHQKPLLPPEGQRSPKEMLPIMKAMRTLTRLRLLVIANMNSQLFAAVFENKPKLQYLHVTSDPRSAVHDQYDFNDVGPLLSPPRDYFPPLKVACMSANSVLGGFSLLASCAPTLKHLTWTIPASSLVTNFTGTDFCANAHQLLSNLRLKGCKLETLRVCVADAGLYESQSFPLARLQYALTSIVSSFTTLRHYELHADASNVGLGVNLLRMLPSGLTRLYTSDKLIAPVELHDLITEKYLYAELSVPRRRARRFQDRWNMNAEDRRHRSPSASSSAWRSIYKTDEDIVFWINPLSYEAKFHSNSTTPVGQAITRRSENKKGRALFLDGIIGENPYDRSDHIPLHSGDLGFVAYEFDKTAHSHRAAKTDETATQTVLRLNGRLLDRERNFHLKPSPAGRPTPWRTSPGPSPAHLETATTSQDRGIRLLLDTLYDIETVEPRDPKAALRELADSGLTGKTSYFGTEDAAMAVFEKEAAATPESLSPYRYPVVAGCREAEGRNGHCEWLCPEAEAVPLGRWDDMREEYRAMKRAEREAEAGTSGLHEQSG